MAEQTAAAAPRAAARVPYDVFVSYSPQDREWVATELVPRLREANLKVVTDYENFVIGIPILENIANALRQSRYTLAVMSADWLQNRWATHVRYLDLTRNVSEGTWRLIPLKLQDCILPAEIGLLQCADFTDPVERAAQWDRLLERLQAAEPTADSTEGQGASVRKAFRSLAGLMRDPGVRDEVIKYNGLLQTVNKQLDVLTHHKYVHDLLHEVQVRCYRPILGEVRHFPATEARLNLSEYEVHLRTFLGRLQEVTRHECFGPTVPWVLQLVRVRQDLYEAVEKGDPPKLQAAVELLTRVISRAPSVINQVLVTLARSLSLAELAGAMGVLCGKLDRPDLEPGRVKEFREGATGLTELDRRLRRLIADHDVWQGADDLLRVTETELAAKKDDFSELELNWPVLRGLMQPLFEQGALPEFREEGEKLGEALATRDPFRALQAFRRYRGMATQLFYEVDAALKGLCDELRTVGRSLNLLLEVISHE